MNILIRSDSSSTIGTGHIMRDLVLAQQFSNHKVIFATQNLKGNINYKIKESGYPIKILKSNTISELNNLIKKLNIDMMIIDHYKIDYKKEKQLKEKNHHLKMMILDDTYEKHHCDILLNHNISADPKKYKNLVPKNCKLKCGSKYTLLRNEFYKEKRKKYKKIQKNTKQKTIFLAMGGADTAKLNIPILKELKKIQNIKVNIVTTQANKELKKLKNYCKNKKWITLNINSSKIAKLMAKSDLAIITPSVTVNEAYFMELPFLAIQTALNQNDIYKYLKRKNYPVMEKFNSYVLKAFLKELI